MKRPSLFTTLSLVISVWSTVVVLTSTAASASSIPSDRFFISDFGQPSGTAAVQSIAASPAPAPTLQLAEGQPHVSYTTPLLTPKFSSNGFGVLIQGQEITEDNIQISTQVRTSSKTTTIAMSLMGEDVKEPLSNGMVATKPVMYTDLRSFSLTITLLADGEHAPRIDDLQIVYFNTASQPVIQAIPQSVTTQETIEEIVDDPVETPTTEVTPTPIETPETTYTVSGSQRRLKIVRREQWGADESLRMTADGEELWPATHARPEVFIVHHTAGSDGGADPASSIRGIYYWHTVVLGWGDIGYNYLIDPAGNIYEGRAGGDGVVGGHTYNSITDVGYNTGSVGIALLGCYEETDGACSTDNQTTPEMRAALVRLLGVKASKFSIKPQSTYDFHGTIVNRVVGHRDLDYTHCPGSTVYAQIPDIRVAAKNQYMALTTPPWRGKLTSALVSGTTPLAQTTLVAGTPHEILLTYKNTGTRKWKKADMLLKIYNKSGKRPSQLRDASWAEKWGGLQMQEEIVAPGETASFRVTVTSTETITADQMLVKLVAYKRTLKKTKSVLSFQFSRQVATK